MMSLLLSWKKLYKQFQYYPDRKFHVAHMGPTWVLSAPGGPQVGPMNLDIRVANEIQLTFDSLRPSDTYMHQ